MKTGAKNGNERNNNKKPIFKNPNDSQAQQCKHYAIVKSRNWKDISIYKEHGVYSMCSVYTVYISADQQSPSYTRQTKKQQIVALSCIRSLESTIHSTSKTINLLLK